MIIPHQPQENLESQLEESDLDLDKPITPTLVPHNHSEPPDAADNPILELKPLPDHLKYIILGSNQTVPVIINSKLTPDQESQLIAILQQHRRAIGWTLDDLTGISPSYCTHHIYLEEGARPSREMQRRLNPNL